MAPPRPFHRSKSRQSARLGVACVLGALMASCFTASCATGVGIEEEVSIIPGGLPGLPSVRSLETDPTAPGAEDILDPALDGAEGAAEEPPPASDEMSEAVPDPNLARGDQSEDDEPSASSPDDEEPETDDPDPLPPDDPPIVDPDDPDPIPPPITPVPSVPPPATTPPPAPTNPPPAPTNPNPIPPLDPDDIPPPIVLPTEGHCLAGWEGSSCDTCSGQTQSDLLACRVYIDCYLLNDCDPLTCGTLEQACGVNRLGNGLAPKGVADSVYSCMCGP